MVRLVHCELIRIFLEVYILSFGDGIFHYLVHLHFVSYAWRRLRILHLVDIMHLVVLMNIVFASTGGCTSRIGVNATYAIVYTIMGVLNGVTAGLWLWLVGLHVAKTVSLAYHDAALFVLLILNGTLCVYGGKQRILILVVIVVTDIT